MTSSKKEKVMLRDLDALRRKIEIISGGTYALTLTTVDPTQVLYNGKFSYLRHYGMPSAGAWCHLLLLRSKQRSSKQLLAIITQTPDCAISIVNWSEQIATFTMNFFREFHHVLRREDEDPNEPTTMTPENTIFVEYLPVGCFVKGGQEKDDIALLAFKWERVQSGASNGHYQANPSGGRRYTDLATINDLIARL